MGTNTRHFHKKNEFPNEAFVQQAIQAYFTEQGLPESIRTSRICFGRADYCKRCCDEQKVVASFFAYVLGWLVVSTLGIPAGRIENS